MSLLRSDRAAPPRTLVAILRDTATRCPDDPAVDSGADVLTYSEMLEAAESVAAELNRAGVGPGERVGVRIPSGTSDLYVAILGVLLAGASYVPVDADDPDSRARLVFDEAGVAALIGPDLVIEVRTAGTPPAPADPGPEDDAWVIFTSGSTGRPKGVAVQHRSAAAFVDAEARLFLQDRPIGPGDRVMAGLSVAFDASCEEMWLAWAHGACLIPAPRSLVRSGMDLGPWMVANGITVVSTVPTLVALWPSAALAGVRLLILGGEACPPELAARLAGGGREVWNTYGPTEATVVACAARLDGVPPVRIGLPLDGWDLAVVGPDQQPVADGDVGELIIGGVGLARYLDPVKDAEKYAPMPTLGWERAYRSGDLVRNESAGLLFVGRADDQVKLGGRRIELGEVDSALLAVPGVTGAAAAVRRTGSGGTVLVGYVAVREGFAHEAALAHLRSALPAPLVPRLAVVDDLPTRTSGKIDRDALPWPVPTGTTTALEPSAPLDGTAGWLQSIWEQLLGVVPGPSDDFFDSGGGSLSAAQLVSALRERFPDVTVAHVYATPTLQGLADFVDEMDGPVTANNPAVDPVHRGMQTVQVLASILLRTVSGLRWLTWVAAAAALADIWSTAEWLPAVSWWWVLAGWLLLVSPAGRILLAAGGARLVLRNVQPGDHPRGGRVHARVWLAELWVGELGAVNLSTAPWMRQYARLLGAQVGRNVDLHAIPSVTGMLRLDDGCSIEAEVDLAGYWIDGDVLHLGGIRVRADARVGARSTLLPGADIGTESEIAPGSAVFGEVPAGEWWSGSPARRNGKARGPVQQSGPEDRPSWLVGYAATSLAVAALPGIATIAAVLVFARPLLSTGTLGEAVMVAVSWTAVAATGVMVVLALLVWVAVRAWSAGLVAGAYPVYSRRAWQAWSVLRVLDEARTWLFPLYSSGLTPSWLRALGAQVGRDVEASTVLLIPKLTTVGEGAFLADDTLLGGYELGGGWMRIGEVKVGKHAFVGNSGMTAPGRKVPRQGLVAVLSAAPARAHAKRGTSWLGSPPEPLRRTGADVDQSRTFHPPRRLRWARALTELCRLVPVWLHAALAILVCAALLWLLDRSAGLAIVLSGVVLLAAGAVAAGLSSLAKWVLVGRLRPSEHPLWSSFVWRNELADTFVEVLAAPWFARAAVGTPVLNVWLRSMGATVGRGVWCGTYWLPEMDLIRLEDGATVNPGCVVQTHLFHDRMLSMDTVTLRAGATLGPNSIVLPAATLGRHSTVGPGSLVMRGESVPDRTRWIGNPVAPWRPETPSS